MRDVLVVAIVFAGCILAIKRPWIGVMLWTWLSIMNPHRYAWSFARQAPLAACAAAATMLGLLFLRGHRESPFKSPAVTLFVVFTCWATLSWVLGINPAGDYGLWSRMFKINVMILIALSLLYTKEHILALAWVVTGSLAILGIKGGIFTIVTGGGFRVWGPPGSFIEDNNAMALALVMTIPLLRFLQLQLQSRWGRWGMTGAMVLCGASVLGSQSRGGFLAVTAMLLLLWWRGKSRLIGGVALAMVALGLLAFMPETWSNRMSTISNYEQDASAMGRITAWWVSWNLAFDYPFGVGFKTARPMLFEMYSPFPDATTRAPHSIYFEVLGNHGFIGLGLFLLLWIVTWRIATKLRREAAQVPEAKWCVDLAGMCQVSLLGYAVGGAFLNLSYFDFPYNIMVLIVLARVWVQRKGWTWPVTPTWTSRLVPGLAPRYA